MNFLDTIALLLLDTKSQEIFAISTERCTRIKHGAYDITAIIRACPLKNIDFVAQGYADQSVEGHLFHLTIEDILLRRAYRARLRPKYEVDFIHPPGWMKCPGLIKKAGKAVWNMDHVPREIARYLRARSTRRRESD